MQTNLKEEPKALQKALEQKQQAEARLAAERTKYAADLRTSAEPAQAHDRRRGREVFSRCVLL